MLSEIIAKAAPKMDATLLHFQGELKTLRTGRANVAMLDGVTVPYYGTPTPLKGVATVTVPDSNQLLITPFDNTLIKAIREAIQLADLGVNPSDDGHSLRINIPQLTAERREELVKRASKLSEGAKIALRNIRGEIWDEIQKRQKASELSEDQRDDGRERIDKLTGEYNKKIEQTLKEKETDIRTI